MRLATTPDTTSGAAYAVAIASCDGLPLCALTLREQREYDGLPHAARRRDWLAGRCAAKRAISARWKVPADDIELASTPGAAPRPHIRDRSGGWAPIPDRLTIAHHDGVAIAATFPSTTSIGVDLEPAGELSPFELRYILSESESRQSHRTVDATLIWILKEAAWKALGLTPSAPLSSLELVFQLHTRELIAVRHGARQLKARADIRRVNGTRPLIAALVQVEPEVA